MLLRFWLIWLIYWIVYLLQPVTSMYPKIIEAWLIQFSFVFIISITYLLGKISLLNTNVLASNEAKTNTINSVTTNKIIVFGLWLSLLGLLFLMYDKIYIQGIDYSNGLAAARQEWKNEGMYRDDGASSLYSAIGYLIGGAYFLPLALSLNKSIELSDKSRFLYMIICFGLLLVNSLLTGGRSSILMALFFVSYGFFQKNERFKSKLFSNQLYYYFMASFMMLFFLYSIFIFHARSLAIEVDIEDYSLDFLEYLGMLPYKWFIEFSDESMMGKFFATINLAISYLTHSIVTTAAIIENPFERGDIIFVNFIQIAAKLGLMQQPEDWFLGGRFSSLPGALLFQYGLLGVAVGAILIGFLSGVFVCLYNNNPSSVLLFFCCSILELILLMSPFLFAGDFLFFPFMLFAGFLIIFMTKIFKFKYVD